jgi:hypothetical protein
VCNSCQSNFSGHYPRNRSTLDIGVLDYIGILYHKERPPEVWHNPVCVCVCVCVCVFVCCPASTLLRARKNIIQKGNISSRIFSFRKEDCGSGYMNIRPDVDTVHNGSPVLRHILQFNLDFEPDAIQTQLPWKLRRLSLLTISVPLWTPSMICRGKGVQTVLLRTAAR